LTLTVSDPVGQEVQTPPCFAQNEASHVDHRGFTFTRRSSWLHTSIAMNIVIYLIVGLFVICAVLVISARLCSAAAAGFAAVLGAAVTASCSAVMADALRHVQML
jgi:uncharacterized membrane protein